MLTLRLWALTAAVAGLVGLGGCARLRPGKLAPGETLTQSDALVFRGYRTTITVKADPEQVMDFFRDPNRLAKLGVFTSVKRDQGRGDLTEIGQKVQVRMRVRGVEFPVTFINLKAAHEKNRHEFWVANSHPFMELQRWQATPAAEGTELRVELFSEEARNWAGRAVNSEELFADFCAVLDQALANLQAQFDPGFDRQAALSQGLRGEKINVLFKVQTAERRIRARPAQVFKYLKEHNNYAAILGDTPLNAECRGNLDLAYCPLRSTIAGREWPVNQFIAGYRVNEEITSILVWSDYLAIVQWKIQPREGGRAASVQARFVIEPPRPGALRMVDFLYALTKVPDRMSQTLGQMQQDLEGGV